MTRTPGYKAGDSLELLASAIFQSQGFLVRRSVPLTLRSGLDATDVDVYGVKFVYPYQPVTLICDCKDKDRPQANARVFWAKGVADFIGASEVYVATKSAQLDTVHFARAKGVKVLTLPVLREFAAQGTADIGAAYGQASAHNFSKLQPALNAACASDRSLKDQIVRAAQAIQSVDPYEDLNLCMEHISDSSSKLIDLGERPSNLRTAWAYVLVQHVVALAVHLLYICSDTLTLSRADRQTYIAEHLTYGSFDKNRAEQIVQATLDYAGRAIGLGSIPGPVPDLPRAARLFNPPQYTDDIVGLVERAVANPKMYHSLPQVLEFILMDAGLVAGRFDSGLFARTFPHSDGPEWLKAAKNIFAFLRSHTRFTQQLVAPGVRDLNTQHYDSVEKVRSNGLQGTLIEEPERRPPDVYITKIEKG